jgi:hypothetical protein
VSLLTEHLRYELMESSCARESGCIPTILLPTSDPSQCHNRLDRLGIHGHQDRDADLHLPSSHGEAWTSKWRGEPDERCRRVRNRSGREFESLQLTTYLTTAVEQISINASCSLDEIMEARQEGQNVIFQVGQS